MAKKQLSTESKLAARTFDALHGAPELHSKKAVAVLREFFSSISSSNADLARGAAAGALRHLVNNLEVDGSASDDDW
jgi:hypothetical protein